MSTQRPAFDDSSLEWKTATTKSGAPYQVGKPKTGNAGAEAEAKAGVRPRNLSDSRVFDVAVDWPASDTDTKCTADFQSKTNISEYELESASFPLYDYKLMINVISDPYYDVHYTYYFTDSVEGSDSYELDTEIDGWHVLRYYSDNATIIRVEGW
ncbi:hypothetical protein FIBSPDRAFT_926068 [Athelia psychrophila]|uniref:Uncharacterized protein n=1 Tax=Athelia psychrophila TaxID=1759441 RepID=A0A166TRU3_9AGAM|nr:hypothetical protein FIBSPDRAFT_926068 [Fibularhizoctonia sp. CBS 109695]